MPFVRGQSGNPKGRPRRDRTAPDKLRADLLRQAPAILGKLVELARDGDVPAAREVLVRCLPPLRPTDRPVSLDLGTDLAQAGQALLAALGAGELSPDQAAGVAGVLTALTRVREANELADRVAKLEARVAQ